MTLSNSRHAPARFRSYLRAHENHVERICADKLRRTQLRHVVPWPQRLIMVGDIGCLGDIRISVEKHLIIVTPDATTDEIVAGDHDIEVMTQIYSYHAAVCGHGMILRYDNNHGREGHDDWHHVHRGNWRNVHDDVGDVEWIGFARWPTLGDVIRELDEWYRLHRDDLPNPDAYADPLSRVPRILYA